MRGEWIRAVRGLVRLLDRQLGEVVDGVGIESGMAGVSSQLRSGLMT